MAKPTIDPTPVRDAFSGFITFTSVVDFTEPQVDQIVQWHKRLCDNVLLVMEFHQDGRKHYHSSVVMRAKSAGGVSRRVATLYKQMGINVIKGVTFLVKTTSDQPGLFTYLLKDQEGREPLLCIGWQLSWIKEQCLLSVKTLSKKNLEKGRVFITDMNAIPYIMKYAEAIGVRIRDKLSYKQVIKLMMADGYNFTRAKHGMIYPHIMAEQGDDSSADMILDHALQFC